MSRKSKKLQEICTLFEEFDIDHSLFEHIEIFEELKQKLTSVNDVRHKSYIKHNLVDIIILTLMAVLSNANEWLEIEVFGKKKELWLRNFLELPNGIPTDDTIRIVISNIDSKYFYNLVIEFLMCKMDEILKILGNYKDPLMKETTEETTKEILSCDGKTSCGSGRKKTDKDEVKALHTLNMYSSDYGFCVGQVFVNEKSNEIPAMIDLLKIIDIKNTILTWDALNTQKDTVKEVIRKGGDYVGALKGNQHNFYKDVVDYFTDDVIKDLKKDICCYKRTKDKEHSAIVTREYFLANDISWLYKKEKWAGLKAIGLERKTIEKKTGEFVIENRFFITSFFDIENYAKAVREHWGVENGLHWHLDFTFKDDKNTTMSKTGAKNLQLIKKIALALLKCVQHLYNCSLKLIRYKLSLYFNREIENIFKMLNTEDLKKFMILENPIHT
jgi:predicted transposase YbfD/YdcC